MNDKKCIVTWKHRIGKLFLLLFVSLIFITSCKKDDEATENFILIYNGKVADNDGVQKVAQMAAEKGYSVNYISNISELPDKLNGAKAFVIGGTTDDTQSLVDDLNVVKADLVSYINNGGRYLGICGGAYIGSKGSHWPGGYETDLGLVDIESFAYDSVYTDPQIISISWKNNNRPIYYQYGPAFSAGNIPANSSILAYYNNANHDVAAFTTKVGSGRILLCGPHPESDETWLSDNPAPLHADQWTNTWDIFMDFFNTLMSD
jgi:glutamine amidotransferase-like uncharacterized protein